MAERRKKKSKYFIPYDYEAAFQSQVEALHEMFLEEMLKHGYKCLYALKEIRSGEQLEIEIYPLFSKVEEIPEAGRIKKDNSKAQNNLNDKNARKYVERLLNTNFGDGDIWVTLTYEDGAEPETWEEALKNMQKYISRVNYHRKKKGLPKARYIYITEYDPDADIRWNHHLIMDGAMEMDVIEKLWKKGRRNRTRRMNKDECGLTGMAHYITKAENRKKGERRWNSSKGLEKPEIRVVKSKQPEKNKGNYKPIRKYVDDMVRDQEKIRDRMKKWYPDYTYTSSEVFYNDFNSMFYIHVRLRDVNRKKGEPE